MIGNRLTVTLLILVVALGALLAWQLRVGAGNNVTFAAAPMPVTLAPESDGPTLRSVPPLEELTETLERPLFVRSRRPPPVDDVVDAQPADEPKEPASNALSIELSAVVLETERQFALFRQLATDRLLKVESGKEIEGWVVREIRADGVRLERGTQSQDLPLRTFKSPAPPAPVRANTARRAKTLEPGRSRAVTQRRPRRPLRGPRQRPVVRQ